MPVVGMNIKTIDAKKHQEIIGPVKVDNVTNFEDIKEHELKAFDKKGLLIEFSFKSEYNAENQKKPLAEIEINGEVFFLDAQHESILKGWKKERKLPDDVNIQIINVILRKCMTRALDLSEELQLPP